MNTKIMNAFGDNEFPYGTDDSSTIAEEPSENMSKDFKNMTYDKYFKNVFSIKRILAVVIRETIDLYEDCTIDEVVGLIEVSEPGSAASTTGLEKLLLLKVMLLEKGVCILMFLLKWDCHGMLIKICIQLLVFV